jgi:Response regulator receiver domain
MAQLLVVEDNPDILHLIWTQMRARGHQVLGASSGPEALAAVELWGPPQVAVLDVAMPSMDGLELLQQLRATTGMQELPAIFCRHVSTARPSRPRTGSAPPTSPSPSWKRSCTPPSRRHLPRATRDSGQPSREPSTGRRALDANGPLENKRGAQGRGHCCVNASIVISGPAVMLR